MDSRIAGQLAFVECMSKHESGVELGTVFHELCHTFWYNRPIKTAVVLKQDFVAAGGASAYRCFEEAAPTALGSGWFAKLATGAPSPFWYSGKGIKPYAQSLLPLIEKYLAEGRTLDADFAKEATKSFEQSEAALKVPNN